MTAGPSAACHPGDVSDDADSTLPDPTGDPAHDIVPPWEAPTGEAMPDPDAGDESELRSPDSGDGSGEGLATPVQAAASAGPAAPTSPPEAVTPLPGTDPVPGQPWTVRVQTAAGVGSVAVEIEGSDKIVVMTRDSQSAGQSPTWTADLPTVGDGPFRYRYAWRSSWNGDVTEWFGATPGRTCGDD